MSLFKRNKLPEVKIRGNRFEIVPAEIIDVPAESPNLPAVRPLSPTVEQLPREGTIPEHSFGA
jgi:hypothetical protein